MSNAAKPTATMTIIPRPRILAAAASNDLSRAEQQRLDDCEKRVEQGLNSFTDTALALMEINTQRLYRPKTWEDYLKDRWRLSRAHGNRFLDAAAIIQHVGKMSPKGDISRLPQNERAYRMLAALTREADEPGKAQIKVLKAAAENTVDAPDIGAADILEAAVKVEIARKPVNKSKRRQNQWQGLKTQFAEILQEIADEKITQRLRTILTAITGLMEPHANAEQSKAAEPKKKGK